MDVLVTTVALVKNRGAFVCTSQLLGVVADLLSPTLFARVINDTGSLNVSLANGLHLGSLCAQRRWKRGWLRYGYNCLGRSVWYVPVSICGRHFLVSSFYVCHTLTTCAADRARQNSVFPASTAVEQVATVYAEYERADCRHGRSSLSWR